MSVLLSIPTEVCHVILSDWLTMNEWSILDVAISNRKLRVWLFEQFKLLSNTEMSYEYLWSVYYWINARSIKLKYLRVPEGFNVSLNLEHVIDLSVGDKAQKNEAIALVNQCNNLRHLSVDAAEFISFINFKILSQLTTIFSPRGQDRDLSCIRDHCTKLRTLKLNYDSQTCHTIIWNIIKNNPKLECLKVSGDKRLIPTIHRCCPSLKNVIISAGDVTLHDLNECYADYNQFEYFEVTAYVHSVLYNKIAKYLYISGFVDSAEQLNQFINKFSNLEIIEFNRMRNMTDDVIDIIVLHSVETLQKFIITSYTQFSAVCLRNLLIRCSSLNELVLFTCGLTNEDITSIFCDAIPNKLTSLSFGACVTTATMVHVLKSCPHLEYCCFPEVARDDDVDENLLKEFRKLKRNKVSISTGVKLKFELNMFAVDEDDDDEADGNAEKDCSHDSD